MNRIMNKSFKRMENYQQLTDQNSHPNFASSADNDIESQNESQSQNVSQRNRRRRIFESSRNFYTDDSPKNFQILLAIIEILQVLGYYIYWIYYDIEPDTPFKNVKYFLFLFFAPFLIIYFCPCFRKMIVMIYISIFLIKMSFIRSMSEFVIVCIFSVLIIAESVLAFILIF
jgi:hypothetical protein